MKNIKRFDNFVNEKIFNPKYPLGGTRLSDNKIQNKFRKFGQNIKNTYKENEFEKLYLKIGEEEILKKLGFEIDLEPTELKDINLNNYTSISKYYNPNFFYQHYIAFNDDNVEWWSEYHGENNFSLLSKYKSLKELLYYFWREYGFYN